MVCIAYNFQFKVMSQKCYIKNFTFSDIKVWAVIHGEMQHDVAKCYYGQLIHILLISNLKIQIHDNVFKMHSNINTNVYDPMSE